MKRMNKKFTIFSLIISLALTLFAYSVPAQSKKDLKKSKQLVDQGNKLFKKKDYRNAIGKYSEALTVVPTNADALYWRGYSHYNLQENDAAFVDLSNALARGYKPADIYKLRWFLNYERKDLPAALADARMALQAEPTDLAILQAAGGISFELNNYADALEFFSRAAKKDTNNGDFHYSVARAHYALGNTQGEENAAEEALKKRTRFVGESYFLLGDALHKQGKSDQAVEAYRKAIGAKPDIYEIYPSLADVYRSQNRFEDAINVLREGLRVFPNDGNFYTDLSWYYSLSNRNDDAIQAAQAGIKFLPNQYMAYTNLCRAYNDVGKPEMAIAACNNALRLKPDDGETYFYLGRANSLLKRSSEASRHYKRAVAGLLDFTNSNPNSSDGFYLLGNAFFADDQRDRAIEAYSRCLQLNPGFVKAMFNLGVIQALQNNKPAAMEQYNALLRLDADLAEKLRAAIDQQ